MQLGGELAPACRAGEDAGSGRALQALLWSDPEREGQHQRNALRERGFPDPAACPGTAGLSERQLLWQRD